MNQIEKSRQLHITADMRLQPSAFAQMFAYARTSQTPITLDEMLENELISLDIKYE